MVVCTGVRSMDPYRFLRGRNDHWVREAKYLGETYFARDEPQLRPTFATRLRQNFQCDLLPKNWTKRELRFSIR